MNLWPFKKRRPVQIQVIPRELVKLRLHEWQSDPGMCGAAGKVLTDPTALIMLQVLHNSSPAFWFLKEDCGLDSRALHQARIEGYNLAIANLEAMKEHRPSPVPLTETFGIEENDKLEK